MCLADFFRIGFGQLPTSLAPVSKYGYKIILVPLLDDIKKLETEGIQVMFEGNQHHFFGTVSMLIADNLAAHAIGGYFCNFSTVHRFCRFYNYCKNQLEQCLPIKTFTLTKTGYENNIAALGTNATYSSLYALKENSCLNSCYSLILSCYIWLTTRSCS